VDDHHYFYIFLSMIALLPPQKKSPRKNIAMEQTKEMGMA
jgi:hypothetical protein